MRIVHRVAALWRALFHSGRIDEELTEEMRFHLEREAEANVSRGLTPEASVRAARRTFGSMESLQERSRDERPGAGLRQLLRDVRLGARQLARAPVFGVTAILIVALGVSAATAVFTVVYGVLLKPLPFRDPEQLVSIWLMRNGNRNLPAAADALDLRALDEVFDDVAFFEGVNLNLAGGVEPQRLQGETVSANLFSVLGVNAALGRTFAPEEEQAGRDAVVVLSDALWRSRFAGDGTIIGRPIDLNGKLRTVVGVMPPGFGHHPSRDDQAWVPLVLDPGEATREVTENYRIIARLAAGATLDRARVEVDALAARIRASYGGNAGMSVDAMIDDLARDVRPALLLLMGAVVLLLLIACANLSNLFAARASARRTELAVRMALGGSRRRLAGQVIAEAVPILLAGGLLGVALAALAVRLFLASEPAGMPRIEGIALSAPVVGFSLALLAVAGIAASLLPIAIAWSSDFTTMTREGGRTATAGRGRATARMVAVAAQIAFALPLLAGASVLLRSAVRVARVDPGFAPEHVITFPFEVLRSKHPTDGQVADYYARLVDAVAAVPGVANVGLANRIPLAGGQTNPVRFEGATVAPDELVNVDTRTVTPDYFAAMGIPVLEGRGFDDRDDADAPLVVMVDDRIARTMWPGESPLGKRLREPPWRGAREAVVIGVVAHVRTESLERDPLPQVYWNTRQWAQDRMALAVRTVLDPGAVIPSVTRAIRSVDADQSVYDVRTMNGIIDRSQARRRLTTLLMLGFGAVALVLAAVGIYGVVAFGVMQRMREFGIRIAIGATRSDVTRLILRQGTTVAIAGAVIGLAVALAGAGILRSLVYEVAPRDVGSIVGATAVLILVAMVASYVPARRAAATDPGITLRSE